MSRYLLDSGVFVGFERGKHAVAALLDELRRDRAELFVPSLVIAEIWRGGRRSARASMLVAACVVEPAWERTARLAGEALGAVRGATTIDAIVAATAKQLGCTIVTADADDLRALSAHFGGLKVIAI